jgi:DNA-binding MarR family transcriptional regulator
MDHTFETIEHEIALLNRLTTALSPKLGELDRSGYILLSKLVSSKSAGINEIADELKLSVSTASRQIASLEEKGFIRRFPDQKNGRISLIEITPKGLEIYQHVKHARTKAYAAILENWADEELENLKTVLSHLNLSLIRWEK